MDQALNQVEVMPFCGGYYIKAEQESMFAAFHRISATQALRQTV